MPTRTVSIVLEHQTVELSMTPHGTRNVVLVASVTLAMLAPIARFANVHQKMILLADQDTPMDACALDVELVTIPPVVALASVATTANVAKAKLFYFKWAGSSWHIDVQGVLFLSVCIVFAQPWGFCPDARVKLRESRTKSICLALVDF